MEKGILLMAYQYWKYETLHSLCMEAFQKFGFTEREADIIQDVLLTADLFGIESHGMQRMVRYHKCIEKGVIKVDANGTILFIPFLPTIVNKAVPAINQSATRRPSTSDPGVENTGRS